MDSENLFKEGYAALHGYITSSGYVALAAQIFATVVFPIIEARIPQKSPPPNDTLINIIYVLHVAVAVYAIYTLHKLQVFTKSAKLHEIERKMKLLRENLKEKENGLKELNLQLRTTTAKSIPVQASLSVLEGLLKRERNNQVDTEEVAKLLAPLITYRTESLEFKSNEKHNFAVYLFDRQTQELKVFYRNCDDRIERHDRSWPVGIGHIGIAFARGETVISGDISSARDLIVADQYKTDKEYYASFISTPIFSDSDSNDKPIGILVITSSRAGHFSDIDKVLAESFSVILSIYFSTFNIGAWNE